MNQSETDPENAPLPVQEGTWQKVSVRRMGRPPKDGNTFIRDRGEGRGVRVAGPKPADLSSPSKAEVLARLAEPGKVDGIIQYKQTMNRKTKLAVMGIPAESLNKGSKEYADMVRNASKYRKSRTKELYENFGYVSTGVSSLLAAESLALGSSRFLYEIAAGLDPNEAAGTLRAASSLADSARQHALCAWELCAKESKVRERNEASKEQTPWLYSSAERLIGQSGGEKRKPGRPRKDALALTEGTITTMPVVDVQPEEN